MSLEIPAVHAQARRENSLTTSAWKSRPGVPLHVQAEARLRGLDRGAAFYGGRRVAALTKVTLSGRWGISRNTLRQAIARLVEEGRLRRVPGRGTRVLTAPVASRAGAWLSFYPARCASAGVVVKNFETRFETRVPPPEVAADLSLAAGVEARLLSRVRGWTGEPAILAESWLRAELDRSGRVALPPRAAL